MVLFRVYKTNFSLLELKLVSSENQEVNDSSENIIVENETQTYNRVLSLGLLHQTE